MIVAVSSEFAIGKDNKLLWHIPEDLAFFKQRTKGHPVVMGSKTWFSLPFRPLPYRDNYVLSRDLDVEFDGATGTVSVDWVLNEAREKRDVFVIGGGEVYALLLPHADELLITHVDVSVPDADTYFPSDLEAFPNRTLIEKGVSESSGLSYEMWSYTK